jgi:hypothetical protein
MCLWYQIKGTVDIRYAPCNRHLSAHISEDFPLLLGFTDWVDPVTVSNIPMQRTQSLILGSEQEENPVIVDSTSEVPPIREEVLKEMEERKQ